MLLLLLLLHATDDDDDDDDVGTVFLEIWKRQRSTLAYEWDVSSFENSEPDRPQFVGTQERQVRYVYTL